MHLRDGADDLLDREGSELLDLEAVRERVMAAARDIMPAICATA